MNTERKEKNPVGLLVPIMLCFICVYGFSWLMDVDNFGSEFWHLIGSTVLITGGIVGLVWSIWGLSKL